MINFTEKLNNRLDVHAFLCEHGKTLRSDKDFNEEISLEHLDGSLFYLENCSCGQDNIRIFIWTEHCGYFYFHKEDIKKMEIITWELIKDEFKLVERKIMTFDMEIKQNGKE